MTMTGESTTLTKESADFRSCRKFPEYEVSAAGTVRNKRHGNVVPHQVDLRDPERRRKVDIIRMQARYSAFVQELVNDAWPELRYEAA